MEMPQKRLYCDMQKALKKEKHKFMFVELRTFILQRAFYAFI
jgi:hypothetical protein